MAEVDWSTLQARCWFTYTDAIEGRKYPCAIVKLVDNECADTDLPKVLLHWQEDEREVFADRVEVQVGGEKWRTVLSVWEEEKALVTIAAPATPSQAPQRHCIICSAIIPPTGKRGRPASKCVECREIKN